MSTRRLLLQGPIRNLPLQRLHQNYRLNFNRLQPIAKQQQRVYSSSTTTSIPRWSRAQKLILFASIGVVVGTTLYETIPPFRYTVIGTIRSTRVLIGVIGAIYDYKLLFSTQWTDQEQRHLDYQNTHLKAARRILKVLKQNGGIYVKLGQHLSSVQLIPIGWSSTMKVLQDQCIPTPYPEINRLFVSDVGVEIDELFESFDPVPIGVASLAQVHRAVDIKTGKKLAVKVMHPTLEEYVKIDTVTVIYMLKFVKWVFPEFEFTWLGEEMQENLPKEMDFRIESNNSKTCLLSFEHIKSTTLKLPEILWATQRILVMEFIDGGRFDDLEYLAKHNIDRNKASQELTRIFSQMIYINGYFHADPHAGNLLIRPAPSQTTKSPYNFEIVLLDHGLYFNLDDQLRVNYSKFWLSLLSSNPSSIHQRKQLAKLVGNIEEENYDIFESAITGRIGLKGNGSLIEATTKSDGKSKEIELKLIKNTLVNQDGIFIEILKILRNVPRRVLMILKVNDLTRSLDQSLNTTHSQIRIWLIVARYCGLAIWLNDLDSFKFEFSTLRSTNTLNLHNSFTLFCKFWHSWWQYQKTYNFLRIVEISMDIYGTVNNSMMYMNALIQDIDHLNPRQGFNNAKRKAAGL
ncbi:hypothetical protein PSTT_14725 [Puccinia striiformis]|uniref:ABC1 atypical kinase-like domain-containing protein n=1 Tax=Puccinia striiformis TaxID=27350 RepID=A0A2S4UL88_9BASI|nr:hypothetical protein PSTT_14725 [Puccinia striiformis]